MSTSTESSTSKGERMLEPTTTATLATKEAKSHPKGRRDRVRRAYNLHLVDGFGVDEQTGMPMLDPVQIVPERLRAFTSCARATDLKAGVHFFLDDYRFEATWSDPERYASMLSRFACVLTPDFSCYLDMPEPMQRWNVYRGRAVGRAWQDMGLCVVRLRGHSPRLHGGAFCRWSDGLWGRHRTVPKRGSRSDEKASPVCCARLRAQMRLRCGRRAGSVV